MNTSRNLCKPNRIHPINRLQNLISKLPTVQKFQSLKYTHKTRQKRSMNTCFLNLKKTIKNLEENYSVRDKQDLLAMSCIQFAAKNLQNKSKSNDSEGEVEKLIIKIIDDIDKSI